MPKNARSKTEVRYFASTFSIFKTAAVKSACTHMQVINSIIIPQFVRVDLGPGVI